MKRPRNSDEDRTPKPPAGGGAAARAWQAAVERGLAPVDARAEGATGPGEGRAEAGAEEAPKRPRLKKGKPG